MKFKVYNENGIVRVTKVTENGVEQTMFSNIQTGQVAEMEVVADISYHAHLDKVSSSNDDNKSTGCICPRYNADGTLYVD